MCEILLDERPSSNVFYSLLSIKGYKLCKVNQVPDLDKQPLLITVSLDTSHVAFLIELLILFFSCRNICYYAEAVTQQETRIITSNNYIF